MTHSYFIAEAGVNHNGDMSLAKQLIDVAVAAGADAVKFQTFKADSLVTEKAQKAAYQQKTTDADESQHAMLKKLELSEQDHLELRVYCEKQKIDFLSTPFDIECLDLLTKELKCKTIKVSSGDLTDGPLLLAIARSGANIILSTGMAYLSEVESALQVIAYGLTNKDEQPTPEALKKAYIDHSAQAQLQQKVSLLHCVSAYPCPAEQVNLKAMDTLKQSFNLPVGLSDHSDDIIIPIAAVARGAQIIEKHFTLDKSLPGPDHQASLEPKALKDLITAIRQVEQALGDGIKKPQSSEYSHRQLVRKSLVCQASIKCGDQFTTDNIHCKRPATGKSPMDYWQTINTQSKQDYQTDEMI